MEQKTLLSVKTLYEFEHRRDGVLLDSWADSNLVPTEGLNSVLGVFLAAAAQSAAWYVGLGSGNYTVAATDAAANIVARVTEITTYTGNRPAITFAAPAAGSITNAASKITFTFNAAVATITNAFIINAATGSAGVLFSSLKLATAKTGFVSGDQLVVTVTVTAASA